MTINRYLAGVEEFELKLFRQLNALKSFTVKEARTATNNTRYLSLCAVALLSSMSAVMRFIIQAIKAFILSVLPSIPRADSNEGLCKSRAFPDPRIGIAGPTAGMEVIISKDKDSTDEKHYPVKEGETCIATPSASTILPDGRVHLIHIPSSELSPPVAIVIKTTAGQIKQSRLIFQSSKKVGVKVFRRFGMDEIPIKATENINPSTDRVLIGDVSVRFGTNLRRACSAH